jgi:hypothetical protein
MSSYEGRRRHVMTKSADCTLLGTVQQERLLLHDCKDGPGSDGAIALVFGIQVAFAHRDTSDVMIAIPATRIVRNLR